MAGGRLCKTVVILNCHDCPFSSWSDHALSPDVAPGYYDRGGEVCSISEVVIPVADNSFTKVHEDCPLRKYDYVTTYTIK